jgi:hypothetical protein
MSLLFCSLSDFFVDGIHVSLFQNGGRFLNPQSVAVNDYRRINGLFWHSAKTIHYISFSIAFDFQSMTLSISWHNTVRVNSK